MVEAFNLSPLTDSQLAQIKDRITLYEGFVWSRLGGSPPLESILARTATDLFFIRKAEGLGLSVEDVMKMSPEELQVAEERAIESLRAG